MIHIMRYIVYSILGSVVGSKVPYMYIFTYIIIYIYICMSKPRLDYKQKSESESISRNLRERVQQLPDHLSMQSPIPCITSLMVISVI